MTRSVEKFTQANYPKIGCGGHVGYCIDIHPDNPSGREMPLRRQGWRPWSELSTVEIHDVLNFIRNRLKKDVSTFDWTMVWWRREGRRWGRVDPRESMGVRASFTIKTEPDVPPLEERVRWEIKQAVPHDLRDVFDSEEGDIWADMAAAAIAEVRKG